MLVFSTIGPGRLFFDFGSFRVFLALFCAICGLFTPKVEVSGKEGKIPLSCSELFLTTTTAIKKLKFRLLKYIFDTLFLLIILFIKLL